MKGSNKLKRFSLFSFTSFFLILQTACVPYQHYQAEPIDTEQVFRDYKSTDLNSREIQDYLREQGIQVEDWPRQSWDLESLIVLGIHFSADRLIADANYEVAVAAQISAAQRINPQLDLLAEYPRDRDESSPWTFGGILSFVIEHPGKRATRIDHAEAVSEVARLESFAVQWQIRAAVTRSFLDVLSTEAKLKRLKQQWQLLDKDFSRLERHVELGAASQFELSSTRLKKQGLHLSISEAQAELSRARSELALNAGLPAHQLDQVRLDSQTFRDLPHPKSLDLELDQLQARALIERVDILRSLSAYVVAEADLHREIENQYPDMNLSPGLIFDQGDKLWALASTLVLPIYARNQGPIAEAEARRKLSSEQFLALQGEVLGEVHLAYRGYIMALNSLHEADKILLELQQAEQRLQVQFEKGYIDHLQLSHHQFASVAAQGSHDILQIAAWRAFTELENALMSTLH